MKPYVYWHYKNCLFSKNRAPRGMRNVNSLGVTLKPWRYHSKNHKFVLFDELDKWGN